MPRRPGERGRPGRGAVRSAGLAGAGRRGRRLRRGAPVKRPRVGRVDLVGGGPGPAYLMTLRGYRLLQEADVIVADRLGPFDELRAEIDPDVTVIDVGKRPGHHPVPQEEINALLVAHAKAGSRVVRLKGGDPFVFGRGGEEVIACQAAGVPVSVTPGVSSVISVPQAAGIPVTHRGVASALHVVNGQGEITHSTLASMADPAVTTVVLMGVSALPRIVSSALDFGVDAATPVAIVENGLTDRQRTIRCTLGDVVRQAEDARVTNPAVIVFGQVARADLLLPADLISTGTA
ncbi:uroporphyrinogen-III C-methyltransferase [Microbacterium sp. MYb72]|nr:uroporphyrinogen-III C-methyltransferase [Microbacterium sp. MYb72]